MRPIKPDVLVALDFGGSLTKGIYQPVGVDAPLQVLKMSPRSIATKRAGLNSMPWMPAQTGFASHPEARAWVRFDSDESIWAVGALAESLYASAGLKSLKWEKAVPKTLAALWVIQQRLKLKSRFKVALSCVLPPGEYESRVLFEARLRAALEEFETPTGTLRVNLQRFECRPESAGVASLYAQQQPAVVPVCAFLMVGYRNASLLLVQDGQLRTGKTSDLGFIRCLELVQGKTSGLDSSGLLLAIAKAAETRNAVPYLNLVPYSDPELRTQHARQLVDVVDTAKATYAQMLFDWFEEGLPTSLNPTLVFSGGTTDVMRPYLETYRPQWAHAYHTEIPFPAELASAALGRRLLDVYGTFQLLCQSVRTKQPQLA